MRKQNVFFFGYFWFSGPGGREILAYLKRKRAELKKTAGTSRRFFFVPSLPTLLRNTR